MSIMAVEPCPLQPHAMKPKNPGTTRRAWTVEALIALLIVFASAFGIWYWSSNLDPIVTIRVPAAPVPNGFEDFSRAAQVMSDPDKIWPEVQSRPRSGKPVGSLAARAALLKKN